MKMTYCLVYEKTQIIDGGFTMIVGPFKTYQAAQIWYKAIDAIYSPEGE
jgi:hypothetical protein